MSGPSTILGSSIRDAAAHRVLQSSTGLALTCVVAAAGLLFSGSGCRSTDRNAQIFHPWGWESAHHARERLNLSQHVVLARTDSIVWEDKGPHMLTPWHVKTTVVRSYKGDWRVGEELAFVHYVDERAPTNTPAAPSGNLVFIFAREHADSELTLETGEYATYRPELEPALDRMFSGKR